MVQRAVGPWCGCLAIAVLAGCASRAVDVAPLATNPGEFASWGCSRIDDELDVVQQRAADVAYAVDERAGTNILALGVGLAVFWPAILAMRPGGPDAADLARLKGRYEALRSVSRDKHCPPPADGPSAARAAGMVLALGERLVYEDRSEARGPAVEWALRLTALRRAEVEYRFDPMPRNDIPIGARTAPPRPGSRPGELWRQDRSGNITLAPPGALQWPQLLRGELVPGAVTAGDMVVVGDPLGRARIRGQVVAVGPQTVAGRRFDVAVLELFGDTQLGDTTTRVDGAIVVDRVSGVLLRLDLRSAHPSFTLQRRLVRVEPVAPG